jgi:hypothetical protein
MAEHVLFAQCIGSNDDIRVLETTLKFLMKDEGACSFINSEDYIVAKQNALSSKPEQQTVVHNNLRISIKPSQHSISITCTVVISGIYPNLKPAVCRTY